MCCNAATPCSGLHAIARTESNSLRQQCLDSDRSPSCFVVVIASPVANAPIRARFPWRIILRYRAEADAAFCLRTWLWSLHGNVVMGLQAVEVGSIVAAEANGTVNQLLSLQFLHCNGMFASMIRTAKRYTLGGATLGPPCMEHTACSISFCAQHSDTLGLLCERRLSSNERMKSWSCICKRQGESDMSS